MDTSYNLESVLQRVNSYVTLKRFEREEYTKAYDAIRNHIIYKMCEVDKVFNDLFNGYSLGGSYADNLKVTTPDEFDLVLHIKIRCRHLVDIKRNPQMPGYVIVNLRRVLETLSRDRYSSEIYNHLTRLVDTNKNLVQNKMQSWIESILTKVLSKYGTEIKSQEKTYYIYLWQKCGPAHTLCIKGSAIAFSIDFVPGLIFKSDEVEWPVSRSYPPYQNNNWIAIPKPIKGWTGNNISFITSFPCEAYFIDNNYGLKNSLRMMKKLRNRQGIENLKSYFIKTAYLLETDNVSNYFWSTHSVSYIFMYMLERILTYVRNKNLPFFWCKEFNQFKTLTNNQLETMYWQLKKCYDFIEKNKESNPNAIYALFLTADEMKSMSQGQFSYEKAEESSWFSSCSLM